MRGSHSLRLAVPLVLWSLSAAAASPAVVCHIVTAQADGMIAAQQLEAIVHRTADVIVDEAVFRHTGISDALEACRTRKDLERCVSAVVIANHAALISEMRGSTEGDLILTGHVTEAGVIEGLAIFIPPDGQWVGVDYMLEPLDARQRPRRGLGEQRGRAEWFAPESTYLLRTEACDMAHRLGFAAMEKHIKIRAFDQSNGFDDGTIDWGGSAIVR